MLNINIYRKNEEQSDIKSSCHMGTRESRKYKQNICLKVEPLLIHKSEKVKNKRMNILTFIDGFSQKKRAETFNGSDSSSMKFDWKH